MKEKILFHHYNGAKRSASLGSLYNDRRELDEERVYMFGIRIPKPQAPGPGQGSVRKQPTKGRAAVSNLEAKGRDGRSHNTVGTELANQWSGKARAPQLDGTPSTT